ncbi:MAG TPA: uroporphyrinogen-III synthase [Pseudolabrys sp.]|jgi:uroporphyrinogen-III synthase|nr:uroporphyrinogen-III synthase [Pseudolabrys sp.]
MRVVVTRPQPDGDRTAGALREHGHEVILAPLMRVETVDADLSGEFSAVIITSANALRASAGREQFATLTRLPLFAVGARSAAVAREHGFGTVISAHGDAKSLVRLIAARCATASAPLLYLAGEDRAADLEGELAQKGIPAKTAVVYRAVTVAFPPVLGEALRAGNVDAILHFSARSAENYLRGAQNAGLLTEALAPRHLCLSAQVASSLAAAGPAKVEIAAAPNEAALLALVEQAQA